MHEKLQPPKLPQMPQPHSSGLYEWSLQYVPHGDGGCGPGGPLPCVQAAPPMVAFRTVGHGACGCGAAKRKSPVGDAANGMPKKPATPSSILPSTAPVDVVTIGAAAAALRSRLLLTKRSMWNRMTTQKLAVAPKI